MKIKILFITWDGPEASYMEGLFMPIFSEINKKDPNIDFHIFQFTWNNNTRVERIKLEAVKCGFSYNSFNVSRKPNAIIGSCLTVFKGASVISNYIKINSINVVMPRSTLPAIMINLIKNKHKNVKVLFDADGLPLEERLEDGSLKEGSLLYKVLRGQEKKIINYADAVLVRSEYGTNYHSINLPGNLKDKFFKVTNGRNPGLYYPNSDSRNDMRAQLGITNDTLLFIYIGSLGPKYALKAMLLFYEKVKRYMDKTRFLILTPSVDYLNSNINKEQIDELMIKTVPFSEVNSYLAAADVGLCMINQTLSMQSASATKLGEYLLAGLPVVATSKIGDVDYYLKEKPFCFLLNDNTEVELSKAVSWIVDTHVKHYDKNDISSFARNFFSLSSSANSYLKAIDSLC